MTTAHSETADAYGRVVAQIGSRERIIRCKDDIQFIAQRREKGTAKRPWRSFSHFATRKGAARLGGAYREAALALFASEAAA